MKANAKMKAEPKAEAAPPKSSKKLLVIIVAGVVVAALAGGAAWFFTQSKPSKPKVEVAVQPIFVPIEQFTVNLQPQESAEQYLQVAITLQVTEQPQADLLKNNMPIVRDRLLLLLSGKRSVEINTPDGKRQLSNEVLAAINEPFVPKGEPQRVTGVSYTNFIIQ